MRENRLGWYGHVKRGNNSEAVKVVKEINVEGWRGIGRKPHKKNGYK